MGGFIRVIGLAIKRMERGMKSLAMLRCIKDIMSMGNPKGVEDITGQMEKFMRESGKMGSSMVQVSGEVLKEIPISDNGNKAKLMDMEFIPGITGTDMKGNSRTV